MTKKNVEAIEIEMDGGEGNDDGCYGEENNHCWKIDFDYDSANGMVGIGVYAICGEEDNNGDWSHAIIADITPKEAKRLGEAIIELANNAKQCRRKDEPAMFGSATITVTRTTDDDE